MQDYDVVLTSQFYESLQGLVSYIRDDCKSPRNAEVFKSGVIQTLENLAIFPERSVLVSEDVRVHIFKGYWLPYKIDGETVYVLDIVDPRQDTKAQKYRNN